MNHIEGIDDHTAGAGSGTARDANALPEVLDPGPADLSEEGVLVGAEGRNSSAENSSSSWIVAGDQLTAMSPDGSTMAPPPGGDSLSGFTGFRPQIPGYIT